MALTFEQIRDRVRFALGKRADLPNTRIDESIDIAQDKIIRMYPWPEIIRRIDVPEHDLHNPYDIPTRVSLDGRTRHDPSEIAYITYVGVQLNRDDTEYLQFSPVFHDDFYRYGSGSLITDQYWYDAANQRIYFRNEKLVIDAGTIVGKLLVLYARRAARVTDNEYLHLNGKDDAVVAYAASDLYRLFNELESAASWKAEGDRIIALHQRGETFGDGAKRENPIGFTGRINRNTLDPHRDPFVRNV